MPLIDMAAGIDPGDQVEAWYAPDGDDAHMNLASLAKGNWVDVLAACRALPAYMRADIYVVTGENGRSFPLLHDAAVSAITAPPGSA